MDRLPIVVRDRPGFWRRRSFNQIVDFGQRRGRSPGAIAIGDDIVGDREQPAPKRGLPAGRQRGEGFGEDEATGVFGRLPAAEPEGAVALDGTDVTPIQGSERATIALRVGDECGVGPLGSGLVVRFSFGPDRRPVNCNACWHRALHRRIRVIR